MTRRSTVTTTALCSLELAEVMGGTLLLTLLPTLLLDTGARGPAPATAVSTAYAVGLAGFMVLGARLGEAFGQARAVLAAGVVATGADVLLTLTGSVWVMAGGRLLQGLAAAVTVPSALALIARTVPEGPDRRRAMSAWGAVSAVGGSAGFLIGGAAGAMGYWRAAFLAPAAISLGLAVLVVALVGLESPAGRRDLDLMGGLLITLTLGLTVAGTSLLESAPGWGGLALLLAAMTGVGLTTVERRSRNPVVRLDVLREAHVLDGSAVAFVNTATTSSSATLLTLTLQAGGDRTAGVTALTLLPFSVGAVVGSMGAPRLLARGGERRVCAAGLLVIAAGIALLPVAVEHAVAVGTALTVTGVGIGLSAAGSTYLGISGDDGAEAPAAALINTAAQLGTAVGIAACLALSTAFGPGPVWLGLAVLAAVASTVMLRRHRLG